MHSMPVVYVYVAIMMWEVIRKAVSNLLFEYLRSNILKHKYIKYSYKHVFSFILMNVQLSGIQFLH